MLQGPRHSCSTPSREITRLHQTQYHRRTCPPVVVDQAGSSSRVTLTPSDFEGHVPCEDAVDPRGIELRNEGCMRRCLHGRIYPGTGKVSNKSSKPTYWATFPRGDKVCRKAGKRKRKWGILIRLGMKWLIYPCTHLLPISLHVQDLPVTGSLGLGLPPEQAADCSGSPTPLLAKFVIRQFFDTWPLCCSSGARPSSRTRN